MEQHGDRHHNDDENRSTGARKVQNTENPLSHWVQRLPPAHRLRQEHAGREQGDGPPRHLPREASDPQDPHAGQEEDQREGEADNPRVVRVEPVCDPEDQGDREEKGDDLLAPAEGPKALPELRDAMEGLRVLPHVGFEHPNAD